jgi:hypothetical protein
VIERRPAHRTDQTGDIGTEPPLPRIHEHMGEQNVIATLQRVRLAPDQREHTRHNSTHTLAQRIRVVHHLRGRRGKGTQHRQR